MEGPRRPSLEEIDTIKEFLDNELDKKQGWSHTEEYPQAFEAKNIHNIRIISEGDKILAHGLTKISVIKTDVHVFNTAMLGSIVTDKNRRGEGYSRSIIESCLQQMRDANCELAILWTDLFDFYRKFGFELCGTEISAELTDAFQPKELRNDLKIKTGSNVDPQAILNLYLKHSVYSHRTADDVRRFLRIPMTHTYTAWNKQGKLEAFAVEGKGSDLQGYVHEWGGSVSGLVTVLDQMRKDREDKKLMFISPSFSTNLLQTLDESGANLFEGVLAMFHIINPTQFMKKIKRGARRMGYGDVVLEYRNGKYYFGYGEHIYNTGDGSDMVRLVFGPMKASEIHDFDPKTKEVFDKIFPINFWVWGWDSV